MSLYDFWIDGQGNAHRISQMDTQYIENCLSQIEKMGNMWRILSADNLKNDELSEMTKVGSKAWYLVNAQEYIDAFNIELAIRKGVEE